MFYYYDKEKAKQGVIWFITSSTELIDVDSISDADKNLTFKEQLSNAVVYEAEEMFSGYPIVEEPNTLRQATRVELIDKGLDFLKEGESIVDGEVIYTPLTLAEQAINMELTKREFLLIVINITKDMVHPDGSSAAITLSMIEEFITQASDEVKLEWTYANHVYRRNKIFENVVVNYFGITAEMLDYIFVNGLELVRKIENGEPLHV